MKGRKPKPLAILKLEDSTALRQRRHKRPEPSAPDGAPDCPAWLDREAKAMWARLLVHLQRLGLLKLTDGEAMASACQAWSVFVRTSRQVSKVKSFDLDSRALVVMNKDARNAWRQWCTEFGLTPSSRTRIDAGVESKIEDEFEAFLDRKAKKGTA